MLPEAFPDLAWHGRAQPASANFSASSKSASWTPGLARRIATFARLGCVRFVNTTTTAEASGSHHKLVPVNPKCPKVAGPARAPALDSEPDLPSNPARSEVPGR